MSTNNSFLSIAHRKILEDNIARREKMIAQFDKKGDLTTGEIRAVKETMESLDTLIVKLAELDLKHSIKESDDEFKNNALSIIKQKAINNANNLRHTLPDVAIPTDIVKGEGDLLANVINPDDYIDKKDDKDV